MRQFVTRLFDEEPDSNPSRPERRVGIVGTGPLAQKLVNELRMKSQLGSCPVAFFDEYPKPGSVLMGIPVFGISNSLRDPRTDRPLNLQELIIASSTLSGRFLDAILAAIQGVGIELRIVPELFHRIEGRVNLSQVRPVGIQDFYRNQLPESDREIIGRMILNKVVLVTGAGSGIGRELCRQIVGFHPRRLLLVDRNEAELFELEEEFKLHALSGTVLPQVNNLLDSDPMAKLLDRHGPDVFIHASGLQHSELAERNPGEAFKRNSISPILCAELAWKKKIGRFVYVSGTAREEAPSVQMATQRFTEEYLQSLYAAYPGATRMITVRLGRLLGPFLPELNQVARQIAAGGPVKLRNSDEKVRVMSEADGAELTLLGSALGLGNEIFSLHPSEPVKIAEIARRLIALEQSDSLSEMQIEYGAETGRGRNGNVDFSGMERTDYERIYRTSIQSAPLYEMKQKLERLAARADSIR